MTAPDNFNRRTALTLLAGSMTTAGLVPLGVLAGENEHGVDQTATIPDDRRLGPLKNLTGSFPFDPPESLEAWATRSQELRRRVLLAAGLWPPPFKAAPASG